MLPCGLQDAIEQGLEPGEPFPNLTLMPGVAQREPALSLQANAAVAAVAGPSSKGVGEDGADAVAAAAAAAQGAADMAVDLGEGGAAQPSLQQLPPLLIVSEPAPR